MSAELFVQAEVPPLTWDEFRATRPMGSIALDGFVTGEPRYDPNGPYLNANHHENVDRLATLSTAQQILVDTQMGLDKAFSVDGQFSPNVFVNDCDQDVCAAWYLLDNISEAKHPSPVLNRFIQVAGLLDVTAGAFPFDKDQRILGELTWVFEPYSLFRASGEMSKKDNAQYTSVIQDVESRIGKHLLGRGDTAGLDLRYKKIGGGEGWSMIIEEGKDGRVGAMRDGVEAYVAVQELEHDRWRYSVARRSEFIPFDVPRLLDRLSEVEGNDQDKWGGARIVGGSPRVGASRLSPSEVEAIINQYIADSLI
ncbi:MAG TPA: hypothetical protein VIM31_01070 [Candidatus Microsaccharimonas sp.]|jgi:hypothetical protein